MPSAPALAQTLRPHYGCAMTPALGSALFHVSFRRPWLPLWVAMSALLGGLVGCGPSPSRAATGEVEDTTGGENVSPTSGPVRSFLPDGVRVRMRVDVTRIRRSPVGPDLSSALMATESFRAWAGSSGLDPIQDLDGILIGGDALYTNRRVIVLRYVGDESALRDRILRMSVDRGVTPAWREVSGFAVVDYPDPNLPVPHVLVLTASHELVLAPADDLSRIVEVARDHAARRDASSPDLNLEPAFVFEAGEVVSVDSEDAMPTYPGYPAGPSRFTVRMTDDADGSHADLRIHGDFTSENDCTAARTFLETQRTTYVDHFMVRAAQLDRPLRDATFTQAATGLDIHMDFTADELRRALGAMALLQASRGR